MFTQWWDFIPFLGTGIPNMIPVSMGFHSAGKEMKSNELTLPKTNIAREN